MDSQRQTNFGLSESKPNLTLEEFTNPLPRTVLRPNTYMLLDGEWQFGYDAEDCGLEENWQLGHTYEHTAQWPGNVEMHIAQAKGQQQAYGWQDEVVVWYEREFPRPEMAAELQHTMFQITFGACGYETRVWLTATCSGLLRAKKCITANTILFPMKFRRSGYCRLTGLRCVLPIPKMPKFRGASRSRMFISGAVSGTKPTRVASGVYGSKPLSETDCGPASGW
jgi:hypothetical protein